MFCSDAEKPLVGCQQLQILRQTLPDMVGARPEIAWAAHVSWQRPQCYEISVLCHKIEVDERSFLHIMVQIWWHLSVRYRNR